MTAGEFATGAEAAEEINSRMSVARIKELMRNPIEENCRLIANLLRPEPQKDERPLAVQLGEANERMLRGESFTLEEVHEILEKLEHFGLIETD